MASSTELLSTVLATHETNPFLMPAENQLLKALDAEEFALLGPHLETVELELRQVLEEPSKLIKDVYFIESGLGSVVAEANGSGMEIGILGRESMTGTAVVLGSKQSPFETFVQVEGQAKRIKASTLCDIMNDNPSIKQRFLCYARSFIVQTAYTAHANGRANIEERLARWLLMAQDRLERDVIELTHEFLALMLGVRRPGVTVAIHVLEGNKLIRATRGQVEILDRDGLKDVAKEFYGLTEAEYERLMGEPIGRCEPLLTAQKA